MLAKHWSHIEELKKISKRRKQDVYLVGGFVRDYLIGRECLDFDFAVNQNAMKLAKSFATKIKGAYIVLDKERNCARVVKKEKGRLATYDFADYRAKSLRGDLNRRDFTINTFAVNVLDLEADGDFKRSIKSNTNAKNDLRAKRIRMVNSKSFKEDPLRLMRAFSMRAQLGFKIEGSTLAQIRKELELIRDVSEERIREELFKILASPRTAMVFKEMDKVGFLDQIMPQVAVMYKVHQGTYHHLDVWRHSLETVVQLEKVLKEFKDDERINDYLNEDIGGNHNRRQVLKLAALLHDIGKPETRKKEKDRISFHGHEHVGRSIVRHIANQLKFSTKERHLLEGMVRWHLRPGYLSNFKRPTDRAIYRYFRDTKEEGVAIALLSMADQRATRGPATTEEDQKHHARICEGLIRHHFKKKDEKPFVRLINGDDLIKKLKLKPSRLFAKILGEVEEKQVLGKISTKEEALSLAESLVHSTKNSS